MMRLFLLGMLTFLLPQTASAQEPKPDQPKKAEATKDVDLEDERASTIAVFRGALTGFHVYTQSTIESARQAVGIADAAIARSKITEDKAKASELLDLARRASAIGTELSKRVEQLNEALDLIEEAKVDLKRKVIDSKQAFQRISEPAAVFRNIDQDQKITSELAAIADRVGLPLNPLLKER